MDRNFLKQSIRRELDYYKDGLFNEDEDEYWERRREEYEKVPKDWKPEPERQILSLDDELDDLEKEYGCKLEDLNEPDIEEIVFRIRGEYPMSAEYDPAFIAIFYKVDPDWRYNIW